MTAIACWFNREESDSIWAVSDSRITQQNSRLTDIVRNYSQSPYQLFALRTFIEFTRKKYSNLASDLQEVQ